MTKLLEDGGASGGRPPAGRAGDHATPRAADRRAFASAWSVAALLGWLVMLCLVPDPRPLGAPGWAVRGVRAAIGVSEPTARLAATVVFRAAGVGMIGVLLAITLRRVRLPVAAPLVLAATPAIAVAVKWVNFGYFPIAPQLWLIGSFALVGALAGLALRRSVAAMAGLSALAVGLVAWGSSTGVPDDLDAAWRATSLHIIEKAGDVPGGDEGFAELLEIAFAYAEDNSHGTDPVLPNRAAILALGVILGEDRVARVGRREIDPGTGEERAALRRRVGLRGRTDLSQHFWVSAALTVLADERGSLAVGLGKEMKDSTPGGSGFSFVDMAANKAGIRFAVAATRDAASARATQMRIGRGSEIGDLFPEIDDLPEGISRDDFRTDYGGLGGPRTRRLFESIDDRINGLNLYR